MNECPSLLNDQQSALPRALTNFPSDSLPRLVAFQVLANAMTKAFKVDQSHASLASLFALLHGATTTSDPLLFCALKAWREVSLDDALIDKIHQAMRDQLEKNPHQTVEDFDRFVDDVFGSFGLIAASLFQTDDSHAVIQATLVEVAKAIGVTRTLRDMVEDVPAGLTLIPPALFEAFHVEVSSIVGASVTEAFAQAVDSLMPPQRRRFAAFYKNIHLFPPAFQWPLFAFVKTQEAILDEIIWNRYDCVNTDLRVSPLRERFLLFRAKRAVKQRARR